MRVRRNGESLSGAILMNRPPPVEYRKTNVTGSVESGSLQLSATNVKLVLSDRPELPLYTPVGNTHSEPPDGGLFTRNVSCALALCTLLPAPEPLLLVTVSCHV